MTALEALSGVLLALLAVFVASVVILGFSALVVTVVVMLLKRRDEENRL